MNTDDPMIVEKIWPIAKLLDEEQTTIVVAGAWKGLYLHYLSMRFPKARVIGFEPQTEAFNETHERISKFNLNAVAVNCGLGLAHTHVAMGAYGSDGCSAFNDAGPIGRCIFKDSVRALSELGLISLFVMNMEGYEYVLLPYLIGSKFIHRIQSIAVQFHPSFCSADLRPALLQHYGEPKYEDYPTWNYWVCR